LPIIPLPLHKTRIDFSDPDPSKNNTNTTTNDQQ
jgi:hypothetical protein